MQGSYLTFMLLNTLRFTGPERNALELCRDKNLNDEVERGMERGPEVGVLRYCRNDPFAQRLSDKSSKRAVLQRHLLEIKHAPVLVCFTVRGWPLPIP